MHLIRVICWQFNEMPTKVSDKIKVLCTIEESSPSIEMKIRFFEETSGSVFSRCLHETITAPEAAIKISGKIKTIIHNT